MNETSNAPETSNSTGTEFTFSCDARGRLVAEDLQHNRHVGLSAMRLFPMSDPDNWIAVFDVHGKELCCIPSVSKLPEGSATAIRTTLTNSEFIPVIHRIVHISSNDPPCRWTVETDRGNTEFIINDEKDLRRLSQWSVLIVDARGIRYSIPDTRKLNAYSRRAVEWHV
ncbi:MAG: DUF1854 domain-containing protein [Pirellulaceae bacterium]|nr:DUF1854 domain-containing protein [Pirellulaceae bacterium]